MTPMAMVVIQGTVAEQQELGGDYTTWIIVGESRFELRASGDAAKSLAAIRTGQWCKCVGVLVEERWETAIDGWRSKVYVKVTSVGEEQACIGGGSPRH